MYVISNGRSYIGKQENNQQTVVTNIEKAFLFEDEQKAINYKENLRSTLKKFGWNVVKYTEKNTEAKDDIEDIVDSDEYQETELEKIGFNILDFFDKTIRTVSQLRQYALNMHYLEKEYNKKIKDTRHYKRDFETKLNAIQLQKLEKFEIQLERERYECKSNRLIAEFFLSDFNQMENIDCVRYIKNIKESKYKPEILTYEMLDEIVGRRNIG